jgi:methylphosphotriester-DNA--protein-cysteine methyltransferase
VVFYNRALDAPEDGYRPCKVCKPMEKLGETPDYIKGIIKELYDNPYLRSNDHDLRDNGPGVDHLTIMKRCRGRNVVGEFEYIGPRHLFRTFPGFFYSNCGRSL